MTALDTRDRLTQSRETYLADYEALQANGAGPVWLRDLRRQAIARFGELSFPTIRDEDWKYTNVAPIVNLPFHSPPTMPVRVEAASEIARRIVPGGGQQLVFLNGRYAADLSAPPQDGVTLGALSSLPDVGGRLVERHLGSYLPYDRVAFSALNAALLSDVATVHVPKGRALAEPIYLTFIAISDDDLTASHPRVLIILDEGAQATVIETYVGAANQRYFTNAVTEIALGDGARIEHCKLVRESEHAFHVGTTQVREGRDSTLTSVAIAMGGALVRNDLNVVLDEEGSSCALYGLYVTGDGQHVDNHTAIEHAKPHGTSRQVYKGILDGRSRAVFNGKVIVHKDAQKTDARQTNRNLLLSSDATVDTKPQLEIFADDVKCAHGAAIGQLDQEALFYLRSRGMSEQTARSLLTYAFASEVVEHISARPLREQLDEQLRSILRQGW